ncbi:hypothetical protein [Arthrobacter sp. IK3]|uniref:hypothetical protein n=1 Tax=Arthrobacter sp. IK3 TaxID=3448169 RepID=UPI003EE13960
MTTLPHDVAPAPEQDYPDEWAEYRKQLDSRVPQQTGSAGSCDACGRFLSKDIWDNTGYGPMLFGGVVSFDPGYISITYKCSNDDCSPDMLW